MGMVYWAVVCRPDCGFTSGSWNSVDDECLVTPWKFRVCLTLLAETDWTQFDASLVHMRFKGFLENLCFGHLDDEMFRTLAMVSDIEKAINITKRPAGLAQFYDLPVPQPDRRPPYSKLL